MAETTLSARLGILPGANGSSKNTWKKPPKPYNDQQQAAWPSPRARSSGSFEPDASVAPSTNVSPSLFDRIGPIASSPVPPKSLLERMELDDNAPSGIAIKGAADDPFLNGEEDGEINVDGSFPAAYDYSRNGEAMVGTSSAKFSVCGAFPSRSFNALQNQAMPPRDRPPPVTGTHFARTRSSPPVNGAQSASLSERLTEAPAVHPSNSWTSPKTIAMNGTGAVSISADPKPATDALRSPKRAPMPLQARIGRALRSAVFQNTKLRENKDTFDSDKVQSRIDIIVTESVSGAFDAQMKKVKQEMDASRAGKQKEEAMARAKEELLHGFGNKSASGEHSDNTWLNRRESHSLIPSLASTSILPTPPPSKIPVPDNMEKDPPKAPRAMLGALSPSLPLKNISFKGKEKAIDPVDEDGGVARGRRSSFGRPSLRASPMNHAAAANLPPRRRSASPPLPPSASRRRSFGRDEMPTYRSPDRNGSLHSRSRSPLRPGYSRSPRIVRRSRSRSRPRPALSPTRSFNSRRPHSFSRSPPPPPSASYSSYSNGFRPHPPRRASRSPSTSRGRTFSGGKPPPPYRDRARSPPNPNSRYAPEKRPFVRSPSPIIRGRRSRSPPPRKRKLTHPPGSRSPPPLGRSARSPSFGSSHGRGPGRRAFGEDRSFSTPRARIDTRGYEGSPNQLRSPFGPPPPAARPPDLSPAPAPVNPCNNVPGLWFVKVGADAPKVVEGQFFVEPGFAATWGLGSSSSAQPELRVLLLCLPTQALNALYNSLIPTNPTAEKMATAVASLQTDWPQEGTLFVGLNADASGGRMWLPYQMDLTAPLDVTHHILIGQNTIRFIQLASMAERTFILYASRRPPPPHSDAALSRLLQPNASSGGSNTNAPLLHFAPATVSVSYSSFL
ncbi:hypothetical protein C8R46DRAFT_1109672 [Mycena filopes]|nr:hypothetical protein C8R46DRAFT_1109672 [Mycena filopes]